ncbi:MAG: ABC transporter substrate-binding protein [Rhizobiales bacterium]|nr:ABC transporter substrate-binding protein [Hyphomicrobiales bacterium]
MRRREFIALAGGAAAAWPLTANAQQSAMPVVGFLVPIPLKPISNNLAGFRKGLGEAGFVEGKSVMLELRPGGGDQSLQERADDLVRLGVTVIMAGAPPAALAAKRATQTIPIVFTSGADPVKIDLVKSFNRPGGNATGFHIQFSELVGKRLSLLHEMVPQAERIAVLVNPAHPSDANATVQNATEAAGALGVDVQVFNAGTSGEIDAAFTNLMAWRAGAVLIGPDPSFFRKNAQIVSLAARHVIPTSYVVGGHVKAGGLMSYGPDLADMYRRAGLYVGRILNGEKPADLPVQQPTKYELIINLKTADALGLTIPATTLARADEVIE